MCSAQYVIIVQLRGSLFPCGGLKTLAVRAAPLRPLKPEKTRGTSPADAMHSNELLGTVHVVQLVRVF